MFMQDNKLQEYITIDSLLEAVKEHAHTKFDWSEQIDVEEFEEVVKSIPRVTNVVPRIEATWQYPEWAPNGGSYVLKRCSNCKYTPEEHNLTQYCPGCGAYMIK